MIRQAYPLPHGIFCECFEFVIIEIIINLHTHVNYTVPVLILLQAGEEEEEGVQIGHYLDPGPARFPLPLTEVSTYPALLFSSVPEPDP
jgi:hypothetical protein